MIRIPRTLLGATLLLVLVLAWSPQTFAFQPETQPEPPPPGGCLGSNDPYCEGGGGGGGGWTPGCKECSWIPDGPDGQPGGDTCILVNDGGHSSCVVDAYGCDTDGQCLLV